MSVSDSEIFYDSLDENEDNSPPDLSTIVPLYTGETSKFAFKLPQRSPKPPKPVIVPKKTARSYLTMYYQKKGRQEKSPDTCRAECGKLSPEREKDLQLEDFETNCCSDSEDEEFYEQFMALEVKTQRSEKKIVVKKEPTRFCFKETDSDRIEKLERLKRRQSYGTKMSMKNRIQLEEAKSLKKIKNTKM